VIVLDTNVLSELMRPAPAPVVLDWVDAHAGGELAVTAISAAELLLGVERLPEGRRRQAIAVAVHDLLDHDFAGRVLAFDGAAADAYATIAAGRADRGRQISMADAQIAAVCRVHGAFLATRNGRDFEHTGVEVLDPWAA